MLPPELELPGRVFNKRSPPLAGFFCFLRDIFPWVSSTTVIAERASQFSPCDASHVRECPNRWPRRSPAMSRLESRTSPMQRAKWLAMTVDNFFDVGSKSASIVGS